MTNLFSNFVKSEEARNALKDADEISEMILFHAMARENSVIMSQTWEM